MISNFRVVFNKTEVGAAKISYFLLFLHHNTTQEEKYQVSGGHMGRSGLSTWKYQFSYDH